MMRRVGRRMWRQRVRRRRAPAGHHHTPQVYRGWIAVAQIIVGPGIRVRGSGSRGGGPQIVMMVRHGEVHFDG